jgi:hypothetical protein
MANYDTFDVDKGREIFDLGYKSTLELLQTKIDTKMVENL